MVPPYDGCNQPGRATGCRAPRKGRLPLPALVLYRGVLRLERGELEELSVLLSMGRWHPHWHPAFHTLRSTDDEAVPHPHHTSIRHCNLHAACNQHSHVLWHGSQYGHAHTHRC